MSALINGIQTEHILNVRNAETNHEMNLAIHDLSKQGVEENVIMRQLAAHSTKDTKAMRAFGLVAVIFLPATFLAVRGHSLRSFKTSTDTLE